MKNNLPPIPPVRKKAVRYAVGATLRYIVGFPFIIMAMGLFAMATGSNPKNPNFLQCLSFFFTLLIPLSVPVSLIAVWVAFFRRDYEDLYFLCWLPILVIVFVYLVCAPILCFPWGLGS